MYIISKLTFANDKPLPHAHAYAEIWTKFGHRARDAQSSCHPEWNELEFGQQMALSQKEGS